MCVDLPSARSARAQMTFPRTRRPELMEEASFSSFPPTPLFFTRSEPARSTRLRRDAVLLVCLEPPLRAHQVPLAIEAGTTLPALSWNSRELCWMVTVKMAWEREERSFIIVAVVVLWRLARAKKRRRSLEEVNSFSLRPTTSVLKPEVLLRASRISMRPRGVFALLGRLMCSVWSIPASMPTQRSFSSSLYISMAEANTLKPYSLPAASCSFFAASRRSKSCSMASGMIPLSFTPCMPVPPDIVWVLPEPVCPYASTQALKPLTVLPTSWETHSL
mmetsp:Transcript_9929/g.28443  ORF Transcript_9929/g.28443 Transcript_9929/m.28443 type:complete len:276 (+) Transcript_9929:2342-3169(+)